MDIRRFCPRIHRDPESSFSKQFEKKIARQILNKAKNKQAKLINENMYLSEESPMIMREDPSFIVNDNYSVGDFAKPKEHWSKSQLLAIKNELDRRGAEFELKFKQKHANGTINFENDLECAENWGDFNCENMNVELSYDDIPPCMKRWGLGSQIAYGCKFMTPDRLAHIPSDILCQFPNCHNLHAMIKPITVLRNHCLPSFVKSMTSLRDVVSAVEAPVPLDISTPSTTMNFVKKPDFQEKKGWDTCKDTAKFETKLPDNYFQNFPHLSQQKLESKSERKSKDTFIPKMK